MCVGGKIVPKYQTEIPEECKNLDKHILYGLIGVTYIEWNEIKEIKSPLVWGCNISFRKSIFNEIGYFPKTLGRQNSKYIGEEERYMQLKIIEEDYKIVYNPNAVVQHKIDEKKVNEKNLIKKSFWQGVSEFKRLRMSGNFTGMSEQSIELSNILKYKLFEEKSKLYSTNNLKDKIDLSRKIGKISFLISNLNYQ